MLELEEAYEFLKKHDLGLADSLHNDLKQRGETVQRAHVARRKREAEYGASVWQRLTTAKHTALRLFESDVDDALKWYRASESALRRTAENVEDEVHSRMGDEVEAGNFVYYIVEEDSNIRQSRDEMPCIYATRESAELACANHLDTVISVAAYNRLYGAFMPSDCGEAPTDE